MQPLEMPGSSSKDEFHSENIAHIDVELLLFFTHTGCYQEQNHI